MKGIILFGHGSRSQEYVQPFNRVRELVAAQQPGVPVELGFLELTQPPLEASIECLAARGVTHIKVVPIFFAPGKHVLKDLPQRIGDAMDRHPGVEFEVAACVGEVDAVIEAMAAHAASGDFARHGDATGLPAFVGCDEGSGTDVSGTIKQGLSEHFRPT